jgi:hypothetical protein
MASRKQTDDRFGEQLLAFLAEPENAARVQQALEAGLAKARDESWRIQNQRRIDQEAEWYGTPEPPKPRRAIAIRNFTHGDLEVEIGDIFSTDDPVVGQVGHLFAVEEN